MKHRITPRSVVAIVVPVVVVAIVVAGMAFAVTRDSGGADAYTIDGKSVSQATINREFDALASNELVSSNTAGSVDSVAGTSWLTTRIRTEGVGILLEDNDLEVTADVRAAVREQVPGLDKLPQSVQDIVYTFSGGGQLIVDKLGEDGANAALAKVLRTFAISVDPKYGRWVRARAQVCPVTGCPAAADSSAGG
jgi:hypothetical protein